MDLEVEVAAGAGGVAGFADGADPLALPHRLTAPNLRRPREVSVEVAAPLAFAVNQQVVAVEDWVVAPTQDPAVADCDQLRPAGGGDVEPFMDAAAAARGVVLPNRPPQAVRSLDREDVPVISDAAIATDDKSWRWRHPDRGGSPDERESRGESALQWCSITRSTMLYSFASSALMK